MGARARLIALLCAAVLCGAVSPGRAQPRAAPRLAPPGAQPSALSIAPADQAGQPTAAALRTQAITIPAGIGMLLQLPTPAATVLSASPDIARVQPASPTSLFLMGVAPGRTTVLATGDSGNAIVQYDVTVVPGSGPSSAAGGAPVVVSPTPAAAVTAQTAAQIQTSILQSVMGAANVRVAASGGAIVLTGTVTTPAAAQSIEAIALGFLGDRGRVVDNLTVLGSIQVNVRVRFAEIDRTVTRQLGFNWQALGKVSDWQVGVATGALAGAPVGGAISTLLPLSGVTGLSGTVPNQFGAGYNNSRWDVNGVIDALAADQLVTILAEPNLTAQSGETASFLAGGEFPVPVAGSSTNGGTTITVDFKQFGISLAVIPTVLSPTRVNLRIRPEVSQLTTNGAVNVPVGTGTLTIPALTVRRAETTVELGSGQSFAIAGLLEHTSTDIANAVPGIGELPVLGALFKSDDFQRGESELVIIVTPYIVKPAPGPQALSLPTDGIQPATDLDRILLGHQIAPAPGGAPLNAGFILK